MTVNPHTPATLSTAQQQAMFFQDPRVVPNPPGFFSTLYLLRRDLNDMLAAMPNSGLWPRAMAIMAGIDLLAKFLANSDAQNGVSARFRDCLARFITRDNNPTSADNQALFQFRNSLLHSFGWYAVSPGGVVYRFRLARRPQNWLVRQNPMNAQNWTINLTQLEIDFKRAVIDYKRQLTIRLKQINFPSDSTFLKTMGGWILAK